MPVSSLGGFIYIFYLLIFVVVAKIQGSNLIPSGKVCEQVLHDGSKLFDPLVQHRLLVGQNQLLT